MRVCIYIDNHPRSRRIGEALVAGADCMGFSTTVLNALDESQKFDLVAGYGWCNKEIFEYYQRNGSKYIYIDLGYWSRKLYRSDYSGYHKCILNGRHPTRYFQKKNRDDRRITVDAPVVRPWRESRKSSHIILAGMSAKGAISVGFQPMEWERRIVTKLRQLTKRDIIYRPKPSWKGFEPIDNTTLSLDTQPISDILINAHVLVTYYSNASIDALAYGVPIYTVDGPARVVSLDGLEQIEHTDKFMMYDRQQFINNISYCHFTKDEIANGMMFRQFMQDGMI